MSRTIALLTSLIVALAGVTRAEDPVYFADETLKLAVEDALWISDPTPTDMLGLVTLTVGSKNMDSITGLEYATNLTSLELPCNWITDVSAVTGMVNMRRLVLNNNQISDISPLVGMTDLEHLDMHDNLVLSNLSPLSGLTGLETLILRGNDISNIAPLAGLTNLQTLLLEHNEISDIAPLAGLTSLTRLDLRNNPLNDEAYEIFIPKIFANNPGLSFSYPASPSHFTISSTAGGSVVTPGEGEFLITQTTTILIEAQADPGFVFAGFSGTVSTTQNPVQVPVDQNHEIRAKFVSVLDTLYVDDDAANDPGPGDTTASDAQERGTLERPFDSIQETIEVAAEGSTIIIRPGTYHENISPTGKCIHLLGIDPNDPNVSDLPVIEATDNEPVVKFVYGEDPNCMLIGLVLSGGQGQPAAAVLCTDSSPTIANCLIVGNRSPQTNGAVVYCRNSQATWINCTITDNEGGVEGVGLRLLDSDVVLLNSILWDNGLHEIEVNGTSDPSISYTNLIGGWPGLGNIDSDPLFAQHGYWGDANDPNVVLDPGDSQAVWIAGDYHLQSQAGRWDNQTQEWTADEVTSPCIDAGDPLESSGREVDPSSIINMGTYGGTAQASKPH